MIRSCVLVLGMYACVSNVASFADPFAKKMAEKQKICIDFNAENIALYPEYHEVFLNVAKKNIVTQNPAAVEAIVYLIKKNPEVVDTLSIYIGLYYDNVHPDIINEVKKYVPDVKEQHASFREHRAALLKALSESQKKEKNSTEKSKKTQFLMKQVVLPVGSQAGGALLNNGYVFIRNKLKELDPYDPTLNAYPSKYISFTEFGTSLPLNLVSGAITGITQKTVVNIVDDATGISKTISAPVYNPGGDNKKYWAYQGAVLAGSFLLGHLIHQHVTGPAIELVWPIRQ